MFPLALLAIAPLRFHFEASEFANAVYHVSCLTGYTACTNSVFRKFWNEDYQTTPADGARLDEWKAIVGRLQNAEPTFAPSPFLPNYGAYYPALRLSTRILSVAVSARSGKDFTTKARFLKSEDARRLGGVLDRFMARLHPWWKSNGEQYARARVRELERAARTLGIQTLASEAAQFLETQFDRRDIYVHAIPSPDPKAKNATAIPLLNHMCIEFTDAFNGEAAAPVALHELVHSSYEAAPPVRHAALVQEFLAAPEPAAQSFYEFLNEAVATGMQLLLLDRNGKKDDDPYSDPFIPRLGAAAMPLIRDAIAANKTIFQGFATNYLKAGSAALKEDASGPGFIAGSICILANDKTKEAVAAFQRIFAPRFTANSEVEFAAISNLNGLRLLRYDELAPHSVAIGDTNSLMKYRGFAIVRPRAVKGRVFYLAGRDESAITQLVERLAQLKNVPRDGLLFTLD